jgi:formiminotetrahydrofolate cyclodeaminase
MLGSDDLSLSTYLERVSSAEPTPGGGAVAALVAALAAALGSMASAISARKSQNREFDRLAEHFVAFRTTFVRLGADDEAAFQSVMEALRLPKDEPSRAARLQDAVQAAAEVPLELCRTCIDLLSTLEPLVDLSSRHAVSDVGVAAHLALAALRASLLNIEINLTFMTDHSDVERIKSASDHVASEGSDRCQRIVDRVRTRIRE